MDVTLLDGFRELSLDRPTHTTKPLEELERLTVDETLTPVERAVYLLSSGQEIQRVSVVNGLSDLLKEHNAEGLRRVVPKVREVLHVAQAEMQLAACAAFLQILQRQLVPVQNYTQTFLQSILTGIDSKDPDVAIAWLETLLDVIELLPKDVIKKDIMSMAIAKGQLAQPVQSRLFCCQILGKTATKFEPFVIKKDILPVVQSLCQDIDYEVRGCMCRQLDPVARGLGLDQTKSAILPELVELTNDEESFVRIAGIETVASMMTLLDDDTQSMTIIPLVCKFCQQSIDSNDVTLPVVAKLIGKICHGLSSHLTDDKRRFFIDWYKQLCKIGDPVENNKSREDDAALKPHVPSISMFAVDFLEEEDQSTECRKNAAFNLPAMVLFIGVRSFNTEMHPVFKAMCADSSTQIRKTVAAGFHEVVSALGASCSPLLPDFLALLHDDNIEVLQGLVEHLDQILKMLSSYCAARPSVVSTKGSLGRSQAVSMIELTPAIISCENKIARTNNWRLQELLFTKLECLPDCFSSEHIHVKYIPLLFQKLGSARALPVRRAIMRTLIICMRHNTRLEQRTDIVNRLINDFAHGESCHQRSLFIDACKIVMELFSRAYFKMTLYDHLVALSMDPVANIRLRLCPLLPLLKGLIKFPTDRALLQSLEQCVRRFLVNEKDKDVQGAVDEAIHILDKVHIRMETELSRKKGSMYDADKDDRTKEAQEQNLLTLEENERKDDELRGRVDRKKEKGRHDILSRIPGPKKALSKQYVPTTSTSSASGSSSIKQLPTNKVSGIKPLRKSSISKGTNNSSSGSSPVSGRRSWQSSASSTSSSRKSSASSVSSALNNRRMSTGGASEVIGRSRRS